MAWLRGIFDQTQKIARLEIERDDLFDRANELEARLTREIDSNRSREDALVAQIVALSGGQTHVPRRTELGEELPKIERSKEADIETEEERKEKAAFEERVVEAVDAFVENARLRGSEIANDPDYRALLEAKIRANPDEYLEN